MSYALGLRDPIADQWCELEEPHQMRGGTYPIGGSMTATINITYNYARHYRRVFQPRASEHLCLDEDGNLSGIRVIYGLTGAEAIPILQRAIELLANDVDEDYWKPTEGNAKRALLQCLALSRMRPDGVWDGD